MQPDQLAAEFGGLVEGFTVLRQRHVRPWRFKLVPEAPRVGLAAKDGIDISRKVLCRRHGAVLHAERIQKTVSDIRFCTVNIAVEGDHVLATSTAKMVKIGDGRGCDNGLSNSESLGRQSGKVKLLSGLQPPKNFPHSVIELNIAL